MVDRYVVVQKNRGFVMVGHQILRLQFAGQVEVGLRLVQNVLAELEIAKIGVELAQDFHIAVRFYVFVGLVHLHLRLFELPILG